MAIKGITDQLQLPISGKIRLGTKKLSAKGSEHPTEAETFILNPEEEILDKRGNPTGKIRINKDVEGLIATLGTSEPAEITFAFPVDSPTVLPDPVMEWYAGNKNATCKCRGDGEYARYKGQEQVSGLNGQIPPERLADGYNRICNIKQCPQALSKKDCKPTMKIFIVVPEYSLYKVFQLTTHSEQSIKAVLSAISVARSAMLHEGIDTIQWVPFTLYRQRTANTHKSSNYITKCTVDKQSFDRELKLLQGGQKSLLRPGLGVVSIDSKQLELAKEEPDYDALPQSMHGHLQTGDNIVEALPPIDKSSWLTDEEVLELFTALAELKGQALTDARMLATFDKFNTRDELLAYLKSSLAKGKKK